MSEPKRGYQDFHEWTKQGKRNAAELAEQGKKDAAEGIEKTLRSRFSAIPNGCSFKPDLQGVDAVTIIRPQVPDARSVHVLLFFRGRDGKEKHETLSLTDEGKILKKIPEELRHLSREAIAAEIAKNLEQIQPEFWSEIETPVLPQGEGVPRGPQQAKEDVLADARIIVDPKRIEHLRNKGARFGGLEKIGLKGYHVFIFDDFMVLENERIENAAYVVAIPKGVVVPETNAPKEKRDAFFEIPEIVQLLSRTKQELIADKERTIRIIHSRGWEKRVDALIAERSLEQHKKAQ